MRFGREELRDIGMAVGALTLAFTIMFVNPFGGGLDSRSLVELLLIVVISLVAVLTGFLMHELAHKIVAVRYGLWAEFRADQRGLLFSLVTAMFGIVLAAPGAVMIAGPVNLRQNGKISAAGPLTNLGFGGGTVGLVLLLGFLNIDLGGFIGLLLFQMIIVNLILGTFNMIPIPPLDGSKILRWNMPLWGVMIAAFISLIAYFFLGLVAVL